MALVPIPLLAYIYYSNSSTNIALLLFKPQKVQFPFMTRRQAERFSFGTSVSTCTITYILNYAKYRLNCQLITLA